LVKVPALEESVHFRLRSSALSFDRFANDYAVSKQFAPEPFVVPRKPGNSGGGKGPQFKTDAGRGGGPGDWATY
jgi:hypothetical protein